MELTERSSAALDIEQSVPLTSEIAWTDLPALPRPASRQRTECRMGCGIVLTVVATCIIATHGGVRTLECASRRWDWLLYVVYAEAAALLCLAGLVFDDPGTVKRSRLTCEPVPPEARAKLHNMAPPNLQNVTGADGRTFCVRCYVWRPREPPAYDGDRFHAHANAHHCSTCQRCVTDFDHHCGVFAAASRARAPRQLQVLCDDHRDGLRRRGHGDRVAHARRAQVRRGQLVGSWSNVILLTFAGYGRRGRGLVRRRDVPSARCSTTRGRAGLTEAMMFAATVVAALLLGTDAYPYKLACTKRIAVGDNYMGSSPAIASANSIKVVDSTGAVVACGSTVAADTELTVSLASSQDAKRYVLEISGGQFAAGTCDATRSNDNAATLALAAGESVSILGRRNDRESDGRADDLAADDGHADEIADDRADRAADDRADRAADDHDDD
ncbi:protein-cysteine S-palmitoyltransferase [Aureococcus anophagefferens]|nr:protein-cysteine S-palmitoyltransferase [Aureococcus anophagefferens]